MVDYRIEQIERAIVNQDDLAHIQKCLAGDRNAFRPLVERYQRSVSITISKMVYDMETVRDLVQDVFINAFSRLSTFDPIYPFKTWIQRIAINRAIDHLRRRRPEMLILDDEIEMEEGSVRPQFEDPKPTPDILLENAEQSSMLQRAVEKLDPDLRSVIVLRHFQDMNYDDIAIALDIPLGTVKNRIFRAREKLQSLILAQAGVQKEMFQ